MEALSKKRHIRVTPRKMRAVADLIRGKKCNDALSILKFVPKAASPHLAKAIKSAVASAVESAGNAKVDPDGLKVSEVRVDDGIIMKRFRPRARGRADRRLKRTSNLLVRVSDQVK